MKIIGIINIAWATVLVALFSLMLAGSFSNSRLLLLAFWAFYLVLATIALRKNKWAVLACALISFAVAIRWVPMVVVNLYAFGQSDPLYVDSPATIFIVYLYALVFAIPAGTITPLLAIQAKRLFQQSNVPNPNDNVAFT